MVQGTGKQVKSDPCGKCGSTDRNEQHITLMPQTAIAQHWRARFCACGAVELVEPLTPEGQPVKELLAERKAAQERAQSEGTNKASPSE